MFGNVPSYQMYVTVSSNLPKTHSHQVIKIKNEKNFHRNFIVFNLRFFEMDVEKNHLFADFAEF